MCRMAMSLQARCTVCLGLHTKRGCRAARLVPLPEHASRARVRAVKCRWLGRVEMTVTPMDSSMILSALQSNMLARLVRVFTLDRSIDHAHSDTLTTNPESRSRVGNDHNSILDCARRVEQTTRQ